MLKTWSPLRSESSSCGMPTESFSKPRRSSAAAWSAGVPSRSTGVRRRCAGPSPNRSGSRSRARTPCWSQLARKPFPSPPLVRAQQPGRLSPPLRTSRSRTLSTHPPPATLSQAPAAGLRTSLFLVAAIVVPPLSSTTASLASRPSISVPSPRSPPPVSLRRAPAAGLPTLRFHSTASLALPPSSTTASLVPPFLS